MCDVCVGIDNCLSVCIEMLKIGEIEFFGKVWLFGVWFDLFD